MRRRMPALMVAQACRLRSGGPHPIRRRSPSKDGRASERAMERQAFFRTPYGATLCPTYYAGEWRPAYDRSVEMLAGLAQGPGRDIVARNTGLIDDMIYTQPVVYEFPLIRVPTLLMIGDKDTTAIGKDLAPPEVRARLGHYPELAQRTKAAIRGSTLIEFPDAGHAPQIQEPEKFNDALIRALDAPVGRDR